VSKFDYTRSKALADKLINQFGQELTFTSETGTSYDPATGTTTSTESTYTADVVWLDYNKDEIDGTYVQSGDARLLVAGTPKINDRVTRGGVEWRIVDTEELNPGGTFIYTEAQARN